MTTVSQVSTRVKDIEQQLADLRMKVNVQYHINNKIETVSGILYNTVVNQQELRKIENQLRNEIDHLSGLVHKLIQQQETLANRTSRWRRWSPYILSGGIVAYLVTQKEISELFAYSKDYIIGYIRYLYHAADIVSPSSVSQLVV